MLRTTLGESMATVTTDKLGNTYDGCKRRCVATSPSPGRACQHRHDEGEDDAHMTKVRVLVGVLTVLVLVGSAVGCGLVSDQTKQEAKNKVEAKAQQARQKAKKKLEPKKQEIKKKVEAGQEDLKKKVDDLKKKVEVGKEEVKKKVDNV